MKVWLQPTQQRSSGARVSGCVIANVTLLLSLKQPKSAVDKASSERGQTALPLPRPAGRNPSARTQPRDRTVNPPSAANSNGIDSDRSMMAREVELAELRQDGPDRRDGPQRVTELHSEKGGEPEVPERREHDNYIEDAKLET
ncbi:hypothetical protein CKAH01_01042 [Colletotrichum kahawae]|uniref:Uncharacterized protein n=1 Tax=Colletotrichum kahawae TaxID=34407 RepID=A0AAD9YC39_COLKA|nr:hypothetical protein CKAH01_01042 [Colletotrichum kahawae]